MTDSNRRRLGFVADAAVEVLAARLTAELPGLGREEIHRIAVAQARDLKADGWKITAPAAAVASASRRSRAPRT